MSAEVPGLCPDAACEPCAECLAEGGFAEAVDEVRYDDQGTSRVYEPSDRYTGLSAEQASALSDALWHDLPGSPCLRTLRLRWSMRAELARDEFEEPTRVDLEVTL